MDYPKDSEQQKRVFLRIPARIRAAIYLYGKFYKKVKLADLSTKGLSFFVAESQLIPDNLEISFRLKRFSRLIRVRLLVMERAGVTEGARIGCAFTQISDKDKLRIEKYICDFVNISFAVQAVNLAAFFCVIEAAFRLLLYFVNFYYSATEFGTSFSFPAPSNSYVITLLVYLFFAFLAFIFSSPAIVGKRKINFGISLFFLGIIFIFILAKNSISWKSGLRYFFWIRLGLILYVGLALVTGILFLKKINLTFAIIKQQLLGLLRFRFMR